MVGRQEWHTAVQPGAAIDVQGASIVYGTGSASVHALRGIDLTVAPGQFVALLGPSGSGKTTLLNVLGALDTLTSGRVRVAGRDLATMSERERTRFRRREVGFVFQQFQLVPVLTAEENVLLAASLVHANGDARYWLDRVGLADRARHFPSQLSGGEQQRVAVARALAKRPRLLLADEPTGNLDSATAVQLLNLLREASGREGCTVVMVTHDEDLARFADRVVRLRDGRIVEDGAAPAAERRNPA